MVFLVERITHKLSCGYMYLRVLPLSFLAGLSRRIQASKHSDSSFKTKVTTLLAVPFIISQAKLYVYRTRVNTLNEGKTRYDNAATSADYLTSET